MLTATASTKFLADLTHNAFGWNIVDRGIDPGLIVAERLKRNLPKVLQAVCRAPANLLVVYPVFIDGIPLMFTNHLSDPVATLIIMIGYFLDKVHELWKIIEVCKK